MRTALHRLAAIGLLAAIGAPAAADAPCAEDAARLCPRVEPGDRRLWDCLLQKQFQLSSACQRNIQEVQRRASEFSADCAQDVYRYCRSTPPGQGRILACLQAYVGTGDLSSNCEQAVVTALEKVQALADAFTDDAARLCSGVQPGGGRIFLCLRAQSERVSSRCRAALNP